jgi:hypothetical protein
MARIKYMNIGIFYLKRKLMKEQMEVTILSESSLLKDWLTPEEDEAWQNL